MKKIKWTIILLVISTFIISGCSEKEEIIDQENTIEESDNTDVKEEESTENMTIKVIAPTGTPTLSIVRLIKETQNINGTAITYENTDATDVLTSRLIKGEADIAIVPTNLAANLYNKGMPYELVGSSIWGVLYLVGDEEITGFEDLKGKTISIIGRGLTPDATFRYLLENYGIDPEEDLTLNYFSGASELAADYIAGQSHFALIPEPVLTNVLMKREDAKVLIDIQEAWQEVTGLSSYPQASLIIKKDLIEAHPNVVADFVKAYEAGIEWVNENPLEAGQYYEALDIGLNAKIIEQAVAGCHFDYVNAQDAKEAIEAYLEVLYNFNPELVGGQLPDEEFFYKE